MAFPFKEKLPLRVAILLSNEDMEKKYKASVPLDLRVWELDFALGQALREGLLLSLSQAFERVSVLRTQPSPGTYHAILVPKIVDVKWDSTFVGTRLNVNVSGVLQVLDQSGQELTLVRGEGQGRPGGGFGVGEGMFTHAISEAISNLIIRWAEQLNRSTELERYAARARPAVTVAPGGPSVQPLISDITISFSYPAEGARVPDESIPVIGIVSAPKGVERLDLVVNGRSVPVSWDVRVRPGAVQSQAFSAQVQLHAGQNVIALTAIDPRGQATQAVRTVHREAGQPTGTGTAGAAASVGERWAVVIGIDQYKDRSISQLRFAAADAEAVYRVLTTSGGVKSSNAYLLLNQDATQRNLRQVLGDLLHQKVVGDDEVIIYYAGHGTTEPDASAEGGLAKYLVPWDADTGSLFSTAIPMEEIQRIFGRLGARKLLMVQDTCFSGGAGGRTFLAKGFTVRAGRLTDRFLQDLSRKEGRLILSASDVNQVSHEDPTLRHGIFTYYFLEGLKGGADLDGDGAVTAREMHLFLQRRVHQHSGGAQTPQLYAIGDMILMRK